MDIKYPSGATPLSPDELLGIKIPAVRTQEDLNNLEYNAIKAARERILPSRRYRKNLLTVSSLLSLHKEMFGDIWVWAGKPRTTEKNIGIDPKQIQSQLIQHCENTQYKIDNTNFSWKDLAANFHHGIVAIHPFANGNGRHARFATEILARNLKLEAPTWGGTDTDLQNITELRKSYIESLQSADKGSLNRLVEFMFR